MKLLTRKYIRIYSSKGQDSSAGIATGFELDGQGLVLDSCLLYDGRAAPGVKRLGREADPSTPSSAEVKNSEALPPLPRTFSWRDAYLSKNATFLYFYFAQSSIAVKLRHYLQVLSCMAITHGTETLIIAIIMDRMWSVAVHEMR
jgi:hypothetical protein